jgi:hypothetical protein
MPRFVVLTHDFPSLHWDFMLEKEAALRTWRLSREPNSGGSIDASPLPDHRIAYLDYEGPVSGDRGKVTRWDAGQYQTTRETPEILEVQLHGNRLRGHVVIARRGEGTSSFEWYPAEE